MPQAQISSDAQLTAVKAAIQAADPDGRRTALVLRNTLDQLYDGQRTRRYRWDQLHKTEKTHCGTLVEINLHREFEFKDGTVLDYKIADVEVDCKYSQTLGGWMIPPETLNHLCLVLWASDAGAEWSMGIVRIQEDRLHLGANRDRKASLNSQGKAAVDWIFDHQGLPPNVLLQLPPEKVDRIMSLRSGVQRVNELFRVASGMRVGRAVVATVGEQLDYMRRIRYNGGARGYLKPEGIIILGQYNSHAKVATALGLPLPGPGESVSAPVVPALGLGRNVAEIDGNLWKIANPADPVTAAPHLPEV